MSSIHTFWIFRFRKDSQHFRKCNFNRGPDNELISKYGVWTLFHSGNSNHGFSIILNQSIRVRNWTFFWGAIYASLPYSFHTKFPAFWKKSSAYGGQVIFLTSSLIPWPYIDIAVATLYVWLNQGWARTYMVYEPWIVVDFSIFYHCLSNIQWCRVNLPDAPSLNQIYRATIPTEGSLRYGTITMKVSWSGPPLTWMA